jgi:hypothetical protein
LRNPSTRIVVEIRSLGQTPVLCGVPFLAVGAADHSHQLFDLPALIGLAAGVYGVFDTVTNMVAKDFLLDPSQGSTDGGDLRHDVDTVSIVLDHAGEAPDLPFDPVEALRA